MIRSEQLALRAAIFKETWQDDLAVGAASTVRALVIPKAIMFSIRSPPNVNDVARFIFA